MYSHCCLFFQLYVIRFEIKMKIAKLINQITLTNLPLGLVCSYKKAAKEQNINFH